MRIKEIIFDLHGVIVIVDSFSLNMNNLFYLELKTSLGVRDPKHENNLLNTRRVNVQNFIDAGKCERPHHWLNASLHV